MRNYYDVIIVGAGHAGCEAAIAASNLGSNVLLLTMNLSRIGQMSCNPAMGGIAKGQIIREIDAMGGMSGIVSDRSMLQFRMLNKSKGPAMWSPRTQNDRNLFSQIWREKLESRNNIDFWQDSVASLLIKNDSVFGVKTLLGLEIKSKCVILTTGTFLSSYIRIGENSFAAGRIGEKNSEGITKQLISFGIKSERLNTGTPPRLDLRSLDLSKMEEQKGDNEIEKFSHWEDDFVPKNIKSCFITYTNESVHEVLRKGFENSSKEYREKKKISPRYCPSILEKITRFAEKQRHQLFIEPEGANTNEVYINGFSTSISYEIQLEALKKIPGFENVKITQAGYDIEYDFFPATQIKRTLESHFINNLYFAGQINGTTGYEEAAGQGLIAGINAAKKSQNLSDFTLSRTESYIGVLIDDLTTKDIKEPYRMFTSRAEFRLILRNDNADLRLSKKAYEIGLIDESKYEKVKIKEKNVKEIIDFFKSNSISHNFFNKKIEDTEIAPLKERATFFQILQRPEFSIEKLSDIFLEIKNILQNKNKNEINQAEIQIKYDFYIKKEEENAEKLKKLEFMKIPKDLDYKKISSLSSEAIEKLCSIKPETISHAKEISGVSPSDISIVMLYCHK